MIKDKRVNIKKETLFDKGWALFTPCKELSANNRWYYLAGVDYIVSQISRAKKITLFLNSTCLPKKVVDELKWVSGIISVDLFAQNEDIIKSYKTIKFCSFQVKKDLSVSVIAIEGEEKESFLIKDGFFKTCESAREILLNDEDKLDLSPLFDVDRVVIIGEDKCVQEEIIKYCKKEKTKVGVAFSVDEFNKQLYKEFIGRRVDLFVGENLKKGICFIKQEKLYGGIFIKGKLFYYEVENFFEQLGSVVYKNLKKRSILFADEIPKNSFVAFAGKITPLKIEEYLEIERDVHLTSFEDYLKENFDKSETEEQNQFSSLSKVVEYKFNLIPPLFTSDFTYSSLYKDAVKILVEWRKLYKVNLEKALEDANELLGSDKLVDIIKSLIDANEGIECILGEYEYSSHLDIFFACKKELIGKQSILLDGCRDLYLQSSEKVSGNQNVKIQEEIEGYKAIIEEKQLLVDRGENVLSNKKRIQTLNQKIKDLLSIQEKFNQRQDKSKEKEEKDFIEFCNGLILSERAGKLNDSVFAIVNQGKEQNKKQAVETFLKRWIYKISQLLSGSITLLDKMGGLDIPEDYKVYDYKGKRYIVIDEMDEYEKTREIRERYNLDCAVRRKG